MLRKLLQNLFLTFIFSLLLTGLFYSMWFSTKQRGFEEGQALTLLFAVGDLFHNIILTIASLPILFLTKDSNYKNIQTRILLYFSGPVLSTLIFIFFVVNSSEDKIAVLLPGLSFIAIHSYFYFKLTQFKNGSLKNPFMMSQTEKSEYITNRLERSGIRHQVSSFDSGCKMIDIWINDQFYCIQLEEGLVGISLVTEEIDLSTIPDRSFHNFDEFKYEFEKIISRD